MPACSLRPTSPDALADAIRRVLRGRGSRRGVRATGARAGRGALVERVGAHGLGALCRRRARGARGDMHIAIDARELVSRPTGVGRYLSRLLEHWDDAAGGTRAPVHAVRARSASAVPESALDMQRSSFPAPAAHGGSRPRLPAALRQARPDVLFAPGYTAPLLCPAPSRWRSTTCRLPRTRSGSRGARACAGVSSRAWPRGVPRVVLTLLRVLARRDRAAPRRRSAPASG